jgi:hypothetical protein
MTYFGQGVDIILEVNCMEISNQHYVVFIRGHLQKVGLAPQSGTMIFDRVFLKLAFRDRAYADFVSNLPRDIAT